MYLYFDRNGILKETINDSALRKGNADANVIYAYFEDDPEITTITFNITPNGASSPIILNQDDDSPVEDEIPYDSKRKLKFFQYYTPYTFYKCTLTAETLAVAGAWVLTILAINSESEQIAKGTYIGDVEDNNLQVDTTITYGEYKFLLGLLGAKANASALNNYQPLLIAGDHITISDTNVIDVRNVESTIDGIELESGTSGTITEDDYELLINNESNYLVLNNEYYYLVYKDSTTMNFACDSIASGSTIIKSIILTIANLNWTATGLNISALALGVSTNASAISGLTTRVGTAEGNITSLQSATTYTETDITSNLAFSITHSLSANIYSGRMIQTAHQLIFDIKASGTANTLPVGTFLTDNITISSTLGARLLRFNNTRVNYTTTSGSNIIAQGTYTYYFDTTYGSGNVFVYSDAQNELNISCPDSGGQVYLEAKTIRLSIRIVIDLL